MEFIYQTESNLDKENNFKVEIIEISEKNNVEKFTGRNKCLISSLDLKLKDEDITKWPDNNKIEALSKLINKTKKKKKKKLSSLNLPMEVTLLNSISFERRPMVLLKEPEKVTYKYINMETKKLTP